MTLIQYFSEQLDKWQYLDFFLRIILACICGAAIGYERSLRSKSAGLRTHIIVCCAAALMMIVSKYGFMDLTTVTGSNFNGTRGADPARIAAQVVSGISFLGAGIIVKHGASVKGLTTAAGIWATAGIGLAIGAGMYGIGLFTMVVVALIQLFMHRVKFDSEGWIETNIDFNVEKDKEFRLQFIKQTEAWKAKIEEIEISDAPDGTNHYEVIIRTSANLDTEEIIRFLSDDERVIRFSVIPEIPN